MVVGLHRGRPGTMDHWTPAGPLRSRRSRPRRGAEADMPVWVPLSASADTRDGDRGIGGGFHRRGESECLGVPAGGGRYREADR